MMQRRLRQFPFPLRSIYRRVHQRVNPAIYPTLFVNEYPKSGGTWVCQMLADALGSRFDDNRFPRCGPSVIKLHRAEFAKGKRIVIIRDPYDVAVSFFHHHREIYADNGFNTGAVALAQKRIFRPDMSEAQALDAFVNHIVKTPITPRLTWGEFYRQCSAREDIILRYEDLRVDAASLLAVAFERLSIPVERAALIKADKANDINAILEKRGNSRGAYFVRSGSIGEGKGILSAQARTLIQSDAGDLLAKFGYAE